MNKVYRGETGTRIVAVGRAAEADELAATAVNAVEAGGFCLDSGASCRRGLSHVRGYARCSSRCRVRETSDIAPS